MSKNNQMAISKNAIGPFREAFAAAQKHMNDALPATVRKYLTAERLTKIALVAIGKTPQLLACEPLSVLRAVMDAASLGLEAGGPLGHAYLVPYGKQCNMITGYRGFIDLARRSGNFSSVAAYLVHENDEFDCTLGDTPKLHHKPLWRGNRGSIMLAYSVANYVDGGKHVDMMGANEIEDIRQGSPMRNGIPWSKHWGEMAKKTVIRRSAKMWPLSVELAQLAEVETRNMDDDSGNPEIMIFDTETGEVKAAPAEQPETKPSTTDAVLAKLQEASVKPEQMTEEQIEAFENTLAKEVSAKRSKE